MELRQLEYFVAVAEEANFTRAAERVHISQSGISAQIRQLEHDLGATLIDRSSRTATLTSAGEAALVHARAALASAEAVRQAVDDENQLVRGRLVVGMVTACTVKPLFDALSAFHLAHPGIEITLIEDNSDRLVDRVRSGGTDLALVATASAPPDGLDAFPIISEGLVAAVAPGHPLARRSRVALAELADHTIVCMPTGTGIRTVFDQACAAAGLRPEIALQASAPDAVADLAIRGLGVAILSESMATDYRGRLTAVPLDDVDIPAVLALVWKGRGGPALRELVRHTRRSFGELQTDPAR
ncbi:MULTISPECIES: LysR family transcriptional regulator [unclassified Rhodococcus (in: high G+C Gram-positive bacteria)]|uniref:LysR family transcriptional regulator n=1 Tax=unclassified Rhodococcus (in: high G+C Gram-positive bacteria) TaxID=192944 RepID=UPI00163B18AA|nr:MULTISPECIES: LysR family transcriptional regulator [unclassified Rhodococcus (in: high G+C Gram-positive bacteria)]MBC2641470.1 LysR family transcriptional regulator [Rhodococcus sp. 3A]MBC2893785.1 LysR family transcriptional regulator [Rhodococcus sp. 4CII]